MAESLGSGKTKRLLVSVLLLTLLYVATGVVFEKERLSPKLKPAFTLQEEDTIKAAVHLYNKIYTDLYVSDGIPLRLDDFPASKLLRHELYKNLGFLRDRNALLMYDMASIEFRDIKRLTPDRAETIVFEEWNYQYKNRMTRMPTSRLKGMGKGFRYILFRDSDTWKVMDYSPADIEKVYEHEAR